VETLELFQRHLDGELDAAGTDVLRAALQDTVTLRHMAETFLIDAHLRADLSQVAIVRAAEAKVGSERPTAKPTRPQKPSRRPWMRRMRSATVGVLLITAGLSAFWLRRGENRGPEPSAGPVARLTRTVDAAWGPEGRGPVSGIRDQGKSSEPISDLRIGQRLHLLRGLAEIQFRSGAVVTLDGPADFTVGEVAGIQNNSGKLASGKLLARVPAVAAGFTVISPTAKVVDLGTEFGITVEETIVAAAAPKSQPPATEVHVLAGRVEVTPMTASFPKSEIGAPATAGHLKSEILSAGQALRVVAAPQTSRTPTVTPLPVQPDQFVRDLAGPDGQIILRENWELVSKDEVPVHGGWLAKGLDVAGQEVFVSRSTSGAPELFGHNVLRFRDDLPDLHIPNPFASWSMPPEAFNRPLAIQFDFRTLRADSTPMFSIAGQGWILNLGPELRMRGGEALGLVETGQWYRLRLDVPAFKRGGGDLRVRLAKRFPDAWRTQLDKTTAEHIDPTRVEDVNKLFFGFSPSASHPLGGIWEMDNLEVRLSKPRSDERQDQ